MKYLPKTYVYTTHEGFIIPYSAFIDRFIDACYFNFGFAPSRSAIHLCSVEDQLDFYNCYQTYVTFEVHCNKKIFHFMSKRYLLNYFYSDIESL